MVAIKKALLNQYITILKGYLSLLQFWLDFKYDITVYDNAEAFRLTISRETSEWEMPTDARKKLIENKFVDRYTITFNHSKCKINENGDIIT